MLFRECRTFRNYKILIFSVFHPSDVLKYILLGPVFHFQNSKSLNLKFYLYNNRKIFLHLGVQFVIKVSQNLQV